MCSPRPGQCGFSVPAERWADSRTGPVAVGLTPIRRPGLEDGGTSAAQCGCSPRSCPTRHSQLNPVRRTATAPRCLPLAAQRPMICDVRFECSRLRWRPGRGQGVFNFVSPWPEAGMGDHQETQNTVPLPAQSNVVSPKKSIVTTLKDAEIEWWFGLRRDTLPRTPLAQIEPQCMHTPLRHRKAECVPLGHVVGSRTRGSTSSKRSPRL